jgi:acetolactate synthase-1/2/3 large subunit
VRNAADIPRVVAEAFYLAGTGRPGPVLIDVTKDAQQASVVPNWDVELDLEGYVDHRVAEIDPAPVHAAAELIASAERPLLLVGNGIIQSGAAAELISFAEKTGIPVITTLHGLGAFPQDHPLSLGMPGMHGWVHVNRAIQRCDVLINIGSRFDDRVTGKAATFAPHAKIIHVDVDPSEIGKLVPVHVGIVGDAKAALRALIEAVPERKADDTTLERWIGEVHELRAKFEPRQAYRRRPDTPTLQPHDVIALLNAARMERGPTRIVTDVGQHQMWAAQLLDWRRPRSHLTSGGSGTMGFAVPAALGAAVACPDETIWVIVGDGGFQMTNQEIATMAQEGLTNVKIAIMNNGYLGMVRQWQQLFEGKLYSGTPLSGPDFAKLAEAYGVKGVTVETFDQAERAIDDAWNTPGIVVIDFRVEREANVFPIVPQGQSIGDMLVDPTTKAEHHEPAAAGAGAARR